MPSLRSIPGVSYGLHPFSRVSFVRRLPRLLLLVLTLSTGCAPEPPSWDGAVPPSRTVEDALGRTLALNETPERVLTLAPNLTEIVYAVGGGDRVVGKSQSDTYPEAVLDLPVFSTYPLDPEGIVALQPDLLLATDQVNSPSDAEAFADLGIPTYFFTFDRVADIPAAMQTMGSLLGTDGTEAIRRFEALVAQTDSAVADAPRPRTLLLIGDEALYTFGRDSYASEAVRIAGGDNLTDAFDEAAPVLSDEWVLEQAPDVIVVLAGWDYDPAQLLNHHPTWDLLPAVQNGRVIGFDPDLLSRPGPRLATGIHELARRLHPDTFAP